MIIGDKIHLRQMSAANSSHLLTNTLSTISKLGCGILKKKNAATSEG